MKDVKEQSKPEIYIPLAEVGGGPEGGKGPELDISLESSPPAPARPTTPGRAPPALQSAAV